MRLAEVLRTRKMLDVIKNDSKVIGAEGSMSSSKSFILGLAFYFRVVASPADAKIFVLAGRDTSWLERSFVNEPASFVSLFGLKYIKAGVGGARIEVQTPTGIKNIYLVGYNNKAQWSKILGTNIRGFLVEEINTANVDFVKQVFGRISRFKDAFLYWNCNGGAPDEPVYVEYLDRSIPAPNYAHDIPASISKQLDECEYKKREDWQYYHFNMEDNPSLDDETRSEMKSTHNPGSYDYLVYVLGERGVLEGALFADLLTDHDVFDFDEDNNVLNNVVLAIDPGNADRCSAIFTLTGYVGKFDKKVVIGTRKSEGRTHLEIIADLNKFIGEHPNAPIQYCFVDDQLKTLIYAVQQHIVKKSITVKYAIKPKIVDRVSLIQQLIHTDRLKMIDTPENRELVKQLKKITTDGKGGYHETGKEEIDWFDSFCYTSTPFIYKMLKYKR